MTDILGETDHASGVPPRFVDAATANLNRLARDFEETQRLRLRAYQRLGQHMYGAEPIDAEKASVLAADPSVQRRRELEDFEARELQNVLQSHVLWPWLEPLKGIRGARTGRLLAAIANPHRFPGQQCSHGHTFPTGYLQEGDACPLVEVGAGGAEPAAETDRAYGATCPGTMQTPRTSTGVRSLWSYLGLMPGSDGAIVRRRKGEQAAYSPQARALVLGPDGLADQIKRHVPDDMTTSPKHGDGCCNACSSKHKRVACATLKRYGNVYAWKKALFVRDRVGEAEGMLTAGRADKIARVVAAKRFVGDLLVAWKEVDS